MRGYPLFSAEASRIIAQGPPWYDDPRQEIEAPECPIYDECDSLPEGRVCGRVCPELRGSLDADPED